MNHDITHCSGEDIRIHTDENGKPFTTGRCICDKRESCHRYIAYLDLPNSESGLYSMMFAQDCVDDNHIMYWEEEK